MAKRLTKEMAQVICPHSEAFALYRREARPGRRFLPFGVFCPACDQLDRRG